jgi:hypothetical protein
MYGAMAVSRQRGEDDSWLLVACIATHQPHEPPDEGRRGGKGERQRDGAGAGCHKKVPSKRGPLFIGTEHH